jgi:hypothetical protein
MRKHSPPETLERSDPLDAGESTSFISLNVGWFESSHAGISSGHLHLFGESQNEIAASRAYGNLNNQRPRQKVGDLPDHLERGCIGMSAPHEKS